MTSIQPGVNSRSRAAFYNAFRDTEYFYLFDKKDKFLYDRKKTLNRRDVFLFIIIAIHTLMPHIYDEAFGGIAGALKVTETR